MLATYEQDSALIDRLIIIDAGLSGNPKLIRRAGIVDMLGGLATTIQNIVAERVRSEGVAGALVTYMGTSALWGIHPMLGVVSMVANAFGYSPGAMFKWAYDEVSKHIKQKGEFTENDAKRIAEQASTKLAVTASLEPLHQLNKEGKISYVLQGRGFEDKSGLEKYAKKGLFGSMGSAVGMLNIFKYFGKGKTSFALLGGIFKWALWAVLMGLTLIEGPKLVANLFGAGYGKSSPSSSEESGSAAQTGGQKPELVGVPTFLTNMLGSEKSGPAQSSQQSIQFSKQNHNMIASGAGEKYFINGPNNQWWIKIPGGDIRNAMVQWATKIYPELRGYETEIRKSRTFDRTAYALARGYDESRMRGWLKVPPSNLHTWRDIVDTFAGEAAMRIKKLKSQKNQKGTK